MSEKFLISLADYSVPMEQMVREGEQIITKIVESKVVVRKSFIEMLRMAGVCQGGAEVCDAIGMARELQALPENFQGDWSLDPRDLKLVQRIVDVMIKRPQSLSGPLWEELILRVFQPRQAK